MKISRRSRRLAADVGLDERRYRWLHFVDGAIVDPSRCPSGIMARPHWLFVEAPVAAGEPNTECLCDKGSGGVDDADGKDAPRESSRVTKEKERMTETDTMTEAEPESSATPAKTPAKKETEPKATTVEEPKTEPAKAPSTPRGGLVVEIPVQRPVAFEAIDETLAGAGLSKTTRADGWLVIGAGETQKLVTAITDRMRVIVAENRSANMYRARMLRRTREAIVALAPDVTVPRHARVSDEPKKAPAAKKTPAAKKAPAKAKAPAKKTSTSKQVEPNFKKTA